MSAKPTTTAGRPRSQGPGRGPASSKHASGQRRAFNVLGALDAAASFAVLIFAAGYLILLWGQAAHAKFYTDECFHAYVSEWIARHSRLPRILPELYSGFYYYYPPLLHVIGAMAVKLFGAWALRFLNVVLTGVLLAVLYFGPPRAIPAAPRRWAVLLVLANGWLTLHAVRFYVETLITLLAVGVVVLLLRFHSSHRRRDAVVLGLGLGLALLAKHTALILPILLVILAVVHAAIGERRLARGLVLAIVIGAVVALPVFIRNQILFGSAFYPALAPDLHGRLYRLNIAAFSPPASRFYLEGLAAAGPLILVATLVAIALIVIRRRPGLVAGLIGFCLVAAAIGPLLPIHESRHLNPVIAILALLASLAVSDALGPRRVWALGLDVVLIGAAGMFLARLPDFRTPLDLTPDLESAYRAVATQVPEGKTILSLWTYDTFYYTRRNTTWPIPWGQAVHPVDLFYERDPAKFLDELRRYSIDYVLMPLAPQARDFNGANYPESFLECTKALVGQGKMKMVWSASGLGLLRREG